MRLNFAYHTGTRGRDQFVLRPNRSDNSRHRRCRRTGTVAALTNSRPLDSPGHRILFGGPFVCALAAPTKRFR